MPPRTEWAADEMRTLRSELDERLDDLVDAVGQTVGQRIDILEQEIGGLRAELRSEIAELRRSTRLIPLVLVAVILALLGVFTTLLLELL